MRPRRRRDPFVFLAPTLSLLALFFFYPLAHAAVLSLFDWDLLTPMRFVGIENYAFLIRSGELARVFWTTLTFSLIVVVFATAIGLALAVAVNRPGRVAAFVRSAVFSAYVVSWVSVALLFLWILDAEAGAFTAILRAVGLPTADWLGDPDWALYSVCGVTIWKLGGYSMILFLTGLQDVPRTLTEAAVLDGASRTRAFWAVTWPLLRPTTLFVATTSLISTFQVFDVVRIMTQGGPVHATTVFVYAIYEQAFYNLRIGRASAAVVAFFAILLGLTALQMLAFRRRGPA